MGLSIPLSVQTLTRFNTIEFICKWYMLVRFIMVCFVCKIKYVTFEVYLEIFKAIPLYMGYKEMLHLYKYVTLKIGVNQEYPSVSI